MNHLNNAMKFLCLGVLLWAGLTAQSALAQSVPTGTWSGTYTGNNDHGTITITLTPDYDGSARGTAACATHSATTGLDWSNDGGSATVNAANNGGSGGLQFGCGTGGVFWTVNGSYPAGDTSGDELTGTWSYFKGGTTPCSGTFTATRSGGGDTTLTPQATTGMWYDPTYDGSGFNVTMSGSGLIFYYYGWDSSGQRLWLYSDIGPTTVTQGTAITLNMHETNGGKFLTPAQSASTATAWGTLKINYSSATAATATLSSTKDGNVTLNMQPIVGMTSAASITGMWYDPTYDGSGFNVLLSSVGSIFYYYGWDGSGQRLWLYSDIGPTTITPGATLTLGMYETNNGKFTTPALSSTATTWGTLKITFSSCTQATATLDGADGTASLNNLQMLVGVLNMPPGC